MAPTLAALLSAPGIGLRVLAGVGGDAGERAEALRRPVSWVAVSELADPRPYLEGGELVLLTGLVIDLFADARAYVDRLVEAGVAALGFGVGVVHPEVPAPLLAAADAARLPLLEVDRPTPFIAVGKALADLLAQEQGKRTRRRLDGMRALTARLARGGDHAPDPTPALRQLAELVDGWAALLDPRARLRVVVGRHPRPEVARRLAEQLRGRFGHTSAADADALGRVTVLPLGLRERPHGYLAVGIGPHADLDHHLVAFAASLLTLDAEHVRGSRPVRRWARAAVLADRAGLDPPAPPDAVLGPFGGARPVRVLVVRRSLEEVLNALDALDEDVVAGVPLDAGECLLVVPDADTDDVLDALGRVPGGLSAAVPDLAELRRAVAATRSLADRARDDVLRSGTAPPSLLDLLGPRAAAAFSAAVLAPVRSQPDGAVLEESLRAYLVAHGALAVAAEALGVHRHTLRARLRRIGTALGRDLDDPSARAELWVALCGPHAAPRI
jgi:purine catabolism regulator